MSLQKIVQEIKQLKPLAEEDIASGPRETYAGREGRKRNAQERMKTLREQYIDELRRSSVFILICGSDRDLFSEVAEKEFGCFVADPEGFYKDLANRMPKELYDQKASTSNLFDIVGRHLEDKANEMQILGYPQLIMKQDYLRAIHGKEDFVALIKQAINEQVGSEIVGINAVRSIADIAIDSGHGSKVTPIVMSTEDSNLALDLHQTLGKVGSKCFLVVAGKGAKTVKAVEGTFTLKEISKENVQKVLTNVRILCNIK